jgi:uncharacterized Tic20 family protein
MANGAKSRSGGDENLLAAVGHPIALVALIVWLAKKDASAELKFQAKQAVIYWALVIVLWVILGILTAVLFIIPVVGWILGTITGLLLFLIWGLAFIYSLFAAYKCYNGEHFKYALIGNKLE